MRKNVGSLTAQERSRFIAAVLALKKTPSVLTPGQPGSNRYDDFVAVHVQAMPRDQSHHVMTAHMCAGFLPWHRAFLLEFEHALQAIDPSVTIPYWDACDPTYHPKTSMIWGPDFLGGDGSGERDDPARVTTGPFAGSTGNWIIRVSENPNTPTYLRRTLGQSRDPQGRTEPLLKKTGETAILAQPVYDVAPWNDHGPQNPQADTSFRMAIEYDLHNLVHRWVGGNMRTAASPNDPVFWLHHCNIDRLWAHWQLTHRDQAPYLPQEDQDLGLNTLLNFNPMGGTRPWTTDYRPSDLLNPSQHAYIYDDLTQELMVPVMVALTRSSKRLTFFQPTPPTAVRQPGRRRASPPTKKTRTTRAEHARTKAKPTARKKRPLRTTQSNAIKKKPKS